MKGKYAIAGINKDGWIVLRDEKNNNDVFLSNVYSLDTMQLPKLELVTHYAYLSSTPDDSDCYIVMVNIGIESGSISVCKMSDNKFVTQQLDWQTAIVSLISFGGNMYALRHHNFTLVHAKLKGQSIEFEELDDETNFILSKQPPPQSWVPRALQKFHGAKMYACNTYGEHEVATPTGLFRGYHYTGVRYCGGSPLGLCRRRSHGFQELYRSFTVLKCMPVIPMGSMKSPPQQGYLEVITTPESVTVADRPLDSGFSWDDETNFILSKQPPPQSWVPRALQKFHGAKMYACNTYGEHEVATPTGLFRVPNFFTTYSNMVCEKGNVEETSNELDIYLMEKIEMPTPNRLGVSSFDQLWLLHPRVCIFQVIVHVTGTVQAYALDWVDSSAKLRTAVDRFSRENLTCNDTFLFRILPDFISSETSGVTFKFYVVTCIKDILVGSVCFLLNRCPTTIKASAGTPVFIAAQIQCPFWKIPQRRQHRSYCLQSYQVRSCNDELNGVSVTSFRDLM
nr:BON1-associated protein [Ipomoea batatas]